MAEPGSAILPRETQKLPKLVQGVTFPNGVEVINTPAQSAA